jgi:hypothetical protein
LAAFLPPQHYIQSPGAFLSISLHAWQRTFRTSHRTNNNFRGGRPLDHPLYGSCFPVLAEYEILKVDS